MALNAAVVLEVRTAGSDTNGGGFKAAATGTDWSQQDAAQYSVTDGVTAGTTTITSLLANFGTDVVGNLIYVAGGTGAITAGWYEIITRTNATTIVVDRSTGLTAGTGATLVIGGALATPRKAFALMTVAGISTWIKSGTYTISTALTFTASLFGGVNRVMGYTTTRGDTGTRPIIRATAGSITILVASNNEGVQISNLDIDGDNQTSIRGASGFSGYLGGGLYNCLIRNCKNSAVVSSNMVNCEITGCSGATAVLSSGKMHNCYIHDNTITAVSFDVNGPGMHNCVIANNTGASSDGIVSSASLCVWGCSIYGNGRHGISVTSFPTGDGPISRNIIYGNGGYGLSIVTAAYGTGANAAYDGNAYGANTSGARSGTVACPHDVTLTANPFTNVGSGDFSLNATAAGGALCRAAGFPAVMPGGLTTGYPDIGAVQHQDSGGVLAAPVTASSPF